MWSIINRPGESRMESAVACDCFLKYGGEVSTKLMHVNFIVEEDLDAHIQMESVDEQ